MSHLRPEDCLWLMFLKCCVSQTLTSGVLLHHQRTLLGSAGRTLCISRKSPLQTVSWCFSVWISLSQTSAAACHNPKWGWRPCDRWLHLLSHLRHHPVLKVLWGWGSAEWETVEAAEPKWRDEGGVHFPSTMAQWWRSLRLTACSASGPPREEQTFHLPIPSSDFFGAAMPEHHSASSLQLTTPSCSVRTSALFSFHRDTLLHQAGVDGVQSPHEAELITQLWIGLLYSL